jgi:hypothetical protein
MLSAMVGSCLLPLCQFVPPTIDSEFPLARGPSPTIAAVKRIASGCGVEALRVHGDSRRSQMLMVQPARNSMRSLKCAYRRMWDDYRSLDLQPIAFVTPAARVSPTSD